MTRPLKTSMGRAVMLAATLILVAGVIGPAANAAKKSPTPCGGSLTKCMKAELTDAADGDHAVVSNSTTSTTVSVKLTILNESSGLTQFVDSCNYTPSSPLALAGADGTTYPIAVTNSSGVPQGSGTATVNGGTLQLRNMMLPFRGKGVVTFTETVPAGSGSAGQDSDIACKLSNGFNNSDPSDPQSNAVATDPATDLHLSWAPAAAANFTVQFVDADGNATNGIQRHAPEPVTGGGHVTYVIRIGNTGDGSGTATLTDQASSGVIRLMDGCTSTPTGINTSQASCSVGPIAPGGFGDVRVDVEVPAVTQNSSTTNTATVTPGNAQAAEDATIVPPVQQCGGYDCVTTWYEPRLGLNVSTGTPTQGNPFAIAINIPAVAAGAGELRTFTELFDPDGCADERPCSVGNEVAGNMFEFFTLPVACGTKQCMLENRYETTLLFDTTPQGCALLCQGWWEDDNSVNHELGRCGPTNFDPKCRDHEDTTSTTITFFVRASAGDGRTGYCLGRICP